MINFFAGIGILTIILIYFLIGGLYDIYEIDTYYSTYWYLYHRKFMKLVKQYPNNYQYRDNNYWYSYKGDLNLYSTTEKSPEMRKYMDKVDLCIIIFYPIFMITTFILNIYDKSRKKMTK